MSQWKNLSGVEFLTLVSERDEEILTPDAVAFIVDLQRTFNLRRKSLLDARHERQKRLDAGEKPDFLTEHRIIQ
jgi:malate synthase